MAKLHHHLAVSTRRGHAGKRQDAVLVPNEPDMQRIIITAALVAGFVGSALAESPQAVPEAPFASTKTSAEVQGELADFHRAGVNPWSTSYSLLDAFRSSNTREAVTAAYVGLRNQVHAMYGEDSGSQGLRMAAQPSPAARTLASR